ncbi:cation/H(+) antiporter 15-like isoform X2 [Rhododendron vialii]|uniref:cation/H(+) antiporter 15-like isoform X2 n=1 Tax=Rhododendron vialii TaxID=182163 RepID=UPI00265F995D|nr:cation/H(+) antiporter 15-like isoform X2 [Rhododendron vialii]
MENTSELLEYLNRTVPCYAGMIYNDNGMWKGTNPLVNTLPLFIIQLTIVILVTRLFLLVFEPLQQPRFIAEVIVGFMFWASALTVTGSSVLPHLLETLKILHTETGKTALSSSLINDICSWVLLALSISVSGKMGATHWSMLSTAAFLLFCIYYLRPSLSWLIHRKPEGHPHSEFHLCCFLAIGVGLCGVLTDACGTHPVIGAFVFGMSMPKGEVESSIVDRVEGFVSGILMPVFFAAVGHRVDVYGIANGLPWAMVGLVVVLACLAKVLSTVFAGYLCGMKCKEAVTLGVVMNTKSLLALLILEVGIEQKALTTQTYTVMVVAVLVMTMIVTPIILATQRESSFVMYKRRTIQKSRPNEDLRVLACVHGQHNLPAIINLLEALNATRDSHIHVFALQLIELIGRASAIRVVQQSSKTLSRNLGNPETDQIVATLENYGRRNDFVSVHQLLVRSAYSTMDEEICSIAEEKRAAFIILPFHKRQGIVGEILEETNLAIRDVNENVLASAPCSVGILINRGLAHTANLASRVVMLYFGGPDDREALSLAWRIAKNPDVTLSVVRFLPTGKSLASILEPMDFMSRPHEVVAVNIERERERQLDDAYLDKFRTAMETNTSTQYVEMSLENEEETVTAIKSMDRCHDLFIVGRGGGATSPLTAGLADWCDCPELGAVGDILITSEHSSAFAVLVVQQYGMLGPRQSVDRSGSTTSSLTYREDIGSRAWSRPSVEEDGRIDSFFSRRTENIHDY